MLRKVKNPLLVETSTLRCRIGREVRADDQSTASPLIFLPRNLTVSHDTLIQ